MPVTPPKILFLAAQVQPFLLAGIKMLIREYDAHVLIVCWKLAENSPTGFYEHPNITYIVKDYVDSKEIKTTVLKFNADIVWASGWMDKDYLKWCRALRSQGKKVVMGIDNQWKGSWKQRVNCLLSPFFLKRIYTHIWVPGYLQFEYARRLGFANDKILLNLYIIDTALFNDYYISSRAEKEQDYPKNLVYVGRLVPHKVANLLKAFNSLSAADLNGWKLVVIGNGSYEDKQAASNEHISFRPFIQQDELADVIRDAGAFCLTSYEEAWGMVIQEFAAAGLPLVISRQCGAQYSMLINNYNGLLCDGDSVEDIKRSIKQLISLPAQQLLEMGKRSNHIATATDPGMWAATLMSVHK